MRLLILLLLVLAGTGVSSTQEPASGDAVLAEARQLFDALDYEQAVPALDRAIASLEPAAAAPGPERALLARAFEMRGRARFGVNDVEGATADFRSLLQIEPAFTLDAQVSPRVVALLDTVRSATVGTLRVTVDPDDASIEVDGRPVAASAEPVPLAAGEIAVKIARVGYRPFAGTVTVPAGTTTELPVTLERTAAAIFLTTSPPGAEVLVDGVLRGRTGSDPLVLTDLPIGTHLVSFRQDCYAAEERQFAIEKLADYRMAPVQLRPAVATVTVHSASAGARVYLDGEPRGTTPATLAEVCEGPHTIGVRGTHGRFSREVTITAGEDVSVEGVLKPAFALLPSGEPSMAGQPDPRQRVERAFGGAERISLYVPSGAEIEAAMDGQPLPSDWLAFDASRRPIGGASAMSVAARRELSARLSKALDVQGVAAAVQPSASSPELVVSVLAAGAGQPDVVPFVAERVDSVNEAVERFDYVPPLFRHGIGAVLLEVIDGGAATARIVVATVDPNGPAGRAGISAGERIMKADGEAVVSAADFERQIGRHAAGDEIALEIADRTGAVRTVRLPVTTRARLVSVTDQTLLFNALAVALRSRLAAADAVEQPFVRLNLAVALLRLGDYQGARQELSGVQLPPGEGISGGTQQYLMGLAYQGLGDTIAAEAAWRAAADLGGSVTEDGPLIRDVVGAKLSR